MTVHERKARDVATIAKIVRIVLVLAVIGALIVLGLKALFFAMPILIGLILARAAVTLARGGVALNAKLTRRPLPSPSHASTKVAAMVIYVILLLLIGALFVFSIAFAIRFLARVSHDVPLWFKSAPLIDHVMGAIDSLSHGMGDVLDADTVAAIRQSLTDLQHSIVHVLPQILTATLGLVSGVFSSLPRIILVLIITMMSGGYFIFQSHKLYRLTRRLVPDPVFVRKTFALIQRLTTTLFRIIGGYLVLMLLTFIESYIGFLLIAIPRPLTWAIVTAIVDVLPVLGISFTMIPMIIVFSVNGQFVWAAGVLILFVVMQIVRRLVEPPILGTAMQLHPLTTLISMILGIAIMGLGGLIVGPLIFFIGKEIYVTFELEAKLRHAIGDILLHREWRSAVVEAERDLERSDEAHLTHTPPSHRETTP